MTNALRLTKKAFTWSVVIATVAWSVGLAALMPHSAQAATCPDVGAGDLVKFEGTTSVYVLNSDMERVYFPNSVVYHQYFADFSPVVPMPISCSDMFPTPGPGDQAGVTVRAGARLVKSMVSTKVYVVAPGGYIHWVSDGDMLSDLYGSDWPSLYDIHDFHRSNYVEGSEWDGMPTDGVLLSEAGSSDVYFVDGGERHMVDGPVPGPAAGDVHEVSAAAMASVADSGATVTPATTTQLVLRSGSIVETPPTTTGVLSVSLAPGNPASDIIPNDATHVPYLTFRAHNTGSSNVVLEEVEAERYGLGDDANFDSVWLEVAGAPVSNEQSVGSDDLVILRPDYTIPAGGFVDFTLVGNLAAAGTDELDAFRIVSATDVDAGGATVGGSFPVEGNQMSYSSFEIGTVTIDERGSNTDVDGGDDSAVIGEFDLDWSSDNEKDGLFKMLRLKQDGSANMSEISNWELWHDGSPVPTTVTVWGDYVTWVLNGGLIIGDGDTERFEIRGDLSGGIDDTDTIIMTLDDVRDVHVQDLGVSYGGQVTNSVDADGNLTLGDLFVYTVDAGQLTVSRDSSNPTSESYAQDTTDVVALVAKVDLGQKIQVDGLKVYLHQDSTIGGTAAGVNVDLERAELWKNGSKIGTLTTVSGTTLDANGVYATTDLHYDFNNSFTIEDNDLLTLVVDIEDNAVTTHTYKFAFGASEFDDPEYVSNTTDVAAGDLSGTASGSDVTIAAASVTITRNDGLPSGQNFVAGAEDQLFFKFLVDVGTASGIELETLNFDFNGPNAYETDNDTFFTNFYLMAEGESDKFSSFEDMTTAGALNFTSLNKEIAANDQLVIGLYGTMQSGVASTNSVTFTLDVSDSDIDDENGTDVTGLSDVASQTLDIVGSALLTVSTDNSETPNADHLASDGMHHLASFRLDADDAPVGITDLYIANNATTSAANTADSGADFLVSQYHLFVDDESVARDSGAPSNGRMQFETSGSNKIIVPEGPPVTVHVWADFNDITDVSQTGQEFDIALYAIEAITEGPDTALALNTGVTTTAGNTILVTDAVTSLDAAVSGEKMMVTKSVPTITREAVQTNTSGDEVVPTLVNATMDVFSFTVSADANGAITWDQITLEVVGDCGANLNPLLLICMDNSNMTLYDSGGNTVAAAFATNTASTALEINLTNPETVSAGGSETYVLEAQLTAFAAGDSISIRVKDNTTNQPAGGETLANALTTAAFVGPFVWSDNSGTYESTTDAQWFTGRNLPGLDTSTQSIVKPS